MYTLWNRKRKFWQSVCFDSTNTIHEVRAKMVKMHRSIKEFLCYTRVAQMSDYKHDGVIFNLAVSSLVLYGHTQSDRQMHAELVDTELDLEMAISLSKGPEWPHFLTYPTTTYLVHLN